MERFDERNEILIGLAGINCLQAAKVVVFGLGGVGGACALDLVRSGVGTLYVLDYDHVATSNLNRLAYGFANLVGMPKAEAFTKMALSINPQICIQIIPSMLGQATDWNKIPLANFYIDAIDTLNAKVCTLEYLLQNKFPCISSMGTGGRLRPDLLTYGNLWEVQGDPLAREVRNRLRRRGITATLPCVWSKEIPKQPADLLPTEISAHQERKVVWDQNPQGIPPGRLRRRQGTMPFVPQAAGHLLASYVVNYLLGQVIPLQKDGSQ